MRDTQQSIEAVMKTTIGMAISLIFIVTTAASFDAYAVILSDPSDGPAVVGKLTVTIAPPKAGGRPRDKR